MSYPSFVFYGKNRVFIDIAKNGCGSACDYCYVPTSRIKQTLLSESEIHIICKSVYDDESYSSNLIISLCPNTEPLKSEASSKLSFQIAKYFLPLGNPLQIATKEAISCEYLHELNELCVQNNQLIINISLPTIKTSRMEPFACNLKDRLSNIKKIKIYPNLSSCLYIKPFLHQTFLEKEAYKKIINQIEPDSVCVGVHFGQKIQSNRILSVNQEEIENTLYGSQNTTELFQFADYIANQTNKDIYFSSVCIIANMYSFICFNNLNKYDERLCRDCSKLVMTKKTFTKNLGLESCSVGV